MIIKCKMCGGDLIVKEGQTICECEYCGTIQTIPTADNEKKINLFNRANSLRIKNEFDKAIAAYQSIISEFPEDGEAHWGMCLCKYGIEYVDDPRTGEKIPTCHRTLFDSIFDDEDFKLAINNADVVAKDVYLAEAKEIDRLQKHIIKISQKEEPYDVFICYKETDENGERTKDSVIAYDIYDKLTEKGYKVFFARVTLEGKLGQEYEPIIFAALRSSKVMLVLGSKPEYFNAVWVKNEWSRFLSFMKDDSGKYLIPCFKDMDAYDMPEELLAFQSQDLGKLGYLQDLTRGLDKLFNRELNADSSVTNKTKMSLGDIYKKLDEAIASYDYTKAEWLIEEAFLINSECAQAYLYKICIKRKLNSKDDLMKSRDLIDGDEDFLKALEYADETFKKELIQYSDSIKNNKLEDKYLKAKNLLSEKKFENAKNIFEELGNYKDSVAQSKICSEQEKETKYLKAKEAMEHHYFERAHNLFKELGDYKDSTQLSKEMICRDIISNQNNEIKVAIQQLDSSRLNKAIAKLEEISYFENVIEIIENAKDKFDKSLLEFRNNEKRKKIIKFTLFGVAALFLVLSILTGTVVVPSAKYNKAINLLSSGNYDEAQEIFDDLNWKDSKQQSKLIDARKALDRNAYESAIDYILSVGGTINLDYTCDIGSFDKTHDSISTKSEFKLPNWVHDGYHITEWNVDSYLIDSSSTNYLANITLRASYDVTSYSISLCKYKEGEVDQTIGYNINKSVSIENPTREGYTFLGWTGGMYTNPVKDLTISTGMYGDLTLVGKWQLLNYNIFYHLDGGTTTNQNTYTIEDNISLSNASKTGYKFVGWYTSDTYETEINSISNRTGDIDIYAKFSVNTYTYILDANGGTFENPVKSIKVTYDYCDSSTPIVNYLASGQNIGYMTKSRNRYRLQGWYLDSNYYNKFDFNSIVSEDITLYAKWEELSSPLISQTHKNSFYSEGDYDFIVDETGTFTFNYASNVYSDISSSYSCAHYTIYINGVKYGYQLSGYDTFQTTSISAQKDDVITVSFVPYIDHYFDKVSAEFYFSDVPTKTYISNSSTFIPETVETYNLGIVYEGLYSLPTPTRNGYQFEGWYLGDKLLSQSGSEWLYTDETNSIVAKWIKK